jgi:hypothetical protein
MKFSPQLLQITLQNNTWLGSIINSISDYMASDKADGGRVE